MTRGEDLVSAALADPEVVRGWNPDRVSVLLRQARSAALLGRLSDCMLQRGLALPEAALAHLSAARRLAQAQEAEVLRELHHIAQALSALGAPVVLLKGAAYLAAGLPAARGRVFSDVDILVPRAALAEAESLLMLAGWMTTNHNEYDQHYYRTWSHELPPMEHVHRHTALDVHHTILPLTARLRPDASLLFEAARPVEGHSGLRVLAPTDMVLHSMTHLFMNEEMSHALRDLSDLDLLLRHFAGAAPDFWPQLLERAARLDLCCPLYYGLRFSAQILRTPVPAGVLSDTRRWRPRWVALMDAIWRRALRPAHPTSALTGQGLALFALYVRGHWLRMPPLMLARHLTIKALRLHERQEASATGG